MTTRLRGRRASGGDAPEPTLDTDKLRAFLSADKASVVAREADCECGDQRAKNRPRDEQERDIPAKP